jgi:hypothetical protein
MSKRKVETLEEWVEFIQESLEAPEEDFPNPFVFTEDKRNNCKSLWITNWLCMSCPFPDKVLERIKNKPDWLKEWGIKHGYIEGRIIYEEKLK